MEKEAKREFTDEECLAIVRQCNDCSVNCAGCPAYNKNHGCEDWESHSSLRLIAMYEEKCKELKEKDALVKSYRDQYIKSREECDKLHAYNTELHEQLDKTLEIADELEKDNKNINLELSLERLKTAASKVSVSAKEAAENTLVFGYEMKVSTLEEEIKKLKEENEELKTANAHLIQLRDEYRAAMPQLTEANNNLREENEKLKKELDIRNADYGKASEYTTLLEKKLIERTPGTKNMAPGDAMQYAWEYDGESFKDADTLMEAADFWKGQYEATKKLLDETKVQHRKAFHECAETELQYERALAYRDDQLKKQPKEIADKIIRIINEPFIYQFKWNLKRYTEKDVVNIVDKVLAEFRTGLINSIKMEEFYGK